MELAFFFPQISRAQHLAPTRNRRTWVVQLRAQYTDHWTTKQSCGVGVPAVQLTTHVKSSTFYRRMGVQVYGHRVIRSYGHTVIRSYGHTVIRSYGHTVIWSYGHTVIRSYGHTVIRSYSHTVIRLYSHTVVQLHIQFFRLDGLLLFCIIVGLRPVSSAII